ncbi:ergothioneine biosynthesis protein EgtC [Thermosynechococcaceae cyanobacterium BACA0444]|uniref:Ergothioneine biosynthesis protein EgtC n=1 Tax=Pseudocalidococcus azoricus BACA0444 TaxID=2918990 RepID=A0AAE4FQ66_9CYAN|nr:ergothioneine biosynthesis protein EgtC [Pseudocalidococcus azoricus]MDS3859643.1 ergothioneine biosynthesis protein EgtC [Pseudocalidococcus azoricus BACA0444]
MCRLLAYLGPVRSLEHLILIPEHSLLVQSYLPREMTVGLLNADGFGVGWYHPRQAVEPFLYRQVLPIWSDLNFTEHLARFVESGCVLASVRSATPGQAVQLSNSQPFRWGRWLGIHNGFIENFRQSLYRPIRNRLNDLSYALIEGTTDSEHLFALFCSEMVSNPQLSPIMALRQTLRIVLELAEANGVRVALNMVVTDGNYLLAARCGNPEPIPTLYWQNPGGVQIASEPFNPQEKWELMKENSLLLIGPGIEPQYFPI